MFKNKTTISSTLKGGQLNLSNGTKQIIKMTNKMIPKIDHSGVEPGYYEQKLNEVKSNKYLINKEYSKAAEFEKNLSKQRMLLVQVVEVVVVKIL